MVAACQMDAKATFDQNCNQTHMIVSAPVSYTHLDVYKRQSKNRRTGRIPARTAPMARMAPARKCTNSTGITMAAARWNVLCGKPKDAIWIVSKIKDTPPGNITRYRNQKKSLVQMGMALL